MLDHLIPTAILKGGVSAAVFILGEATLDVHGVEQEIVLAAAAFGGVAAIWALFTRALRSIVHETVNNAPKIASLEKSIEDAAKTAATNTELLLRLIGHGDHVQADLVSERDRVREDLLAERRHAGD